MPYISPSPALPKPPSPTLSPAGGEMESCSLSLWQGLSERASLSPFPLERVGLYPQDYFRSPLAIPLFLAGNFGEIRPNHFHAGLDFKTDGVEGKNVYAAADGYVSRIKISPFGYGKAIYIKHPNGYTTVYAHLKKFNETIEEFTQKVQYYKESYTIELFPGTTQLPVKKGDIIALSGNTGGSGGPHLHFEIRDSKTEYPINPLLFGFEIKDNIKPLIKRLAVYPLDENSFVNNKNVPKIMSVYGSKGNYKISSKNVITVHGKIGFGIETLDHLNGTSNRTGVFSIELLVDSTLIYSHKMERIGFYESRYINSHIDYSEKVKNGRRIQKSFLQPNNKLNIYQNIKNNGIITFDEDSTHHVEYIVKDAFGNVSTLKLIVISKTKTGTNKMEGETYTEYFKYNKHNKFKRDGIMIDMPSNILYDDLKFKYSTGDTLKGALTPTYNIHNMYVPLHSYMTLSIKVDGIKQELINKALIVSLSKGGNKLAEGGTYKNNYITVKTRSLGAYTVMLDTLSPKITPLNISQNRNMSARKSIIMKIGDNLSGIQSYRGTIDDKWILMEYDYKKAKLVYYFDAQRVKKGKHTFRLVVIDERGNQSEYKANFVR